MSLTREADALVAAKSQNVDRYKRNFLRQAVCELRFPTLMELGEARPPASFVAALRKEYPHLELGNEVTLGIAGGMPGSNNTHIFRSAKLTWSVTLKQSALTIETTAYTEYAQLKDRLLRVIDAAAKIIDSDFFTRVGLRYINVIDSETDPTDGWINPALVAPITSGSFLGIQEYAGKIQLGAPDGGCILQHGIRIIKQKFDKDISTEYVIDVDTFRNEVALSDTEVIIDAMHAQAFDIFDWAIGPRAQSFLAAEKGASKN